MTLLLRMSMTFWMNVPMLPVAPVTASAGLAAAALVSIPGAAASAAQCGSYPFRDPGLPLSTRTHDLLSRLTIVQKIGFLFQYQPAIPAPLCLPDFKTGTLPECLLKELQRWPFKPYQGEQATVGLQFKIGKGS